MAQIDPYNPLDLEALGESLLRELEKKPHLRLDKLQSFTGAGIYALYYQGQDDPYAEIGRYNRRHGCLLPIYVGRSKDPGARQGRSPAAPVAGAPLYQRVRQHAASLKSAGFEMQDFAYRALVVMPIWIPLAEAVVIRRYLPLWNGHLQGFGIHAPGGGRSGQKVSDWDLLHPGRRFAKGLRTSAKNRETLLASIREQGHASVRHHQVLLRGNS
jgi:hypothetical protein